MEQASGKLAVFFDPPFWVGVFERIEDGKLTVFKVTYGAEPKDYEVYDFFLHHYFELKFSPPISADVKQAAVNIIGKNGRITNPGFFINTPPFLRLIWRKEQRFSGAAELFLCKVKHNI